MAELDDAGPHELIEEQNKGAIERARRLIEEMKEAARRERLILNSSPEKSEK